MHAGLSEPSIPVIRLIGVVDDARYNNRRSAILEQIDPLRQSTVSFRHDVQEILNCPGNAVALGLTRNDHGIERQKLFDEFLVLSSDLASLSVRHYLRAQNGIVLRRRVVSLEAKVRLTVAGDRVKEDSFLKGGNQRVPNSSEHGVIGPDGKVVLPRILQSVRIMKEVSARVTRIQIQAARNFRIESPPAEFDIRSRHLSKRGGVLSSVVHEIDRMKDLHRLVRVHRGNDLCNDSEISI